MANPPKKILHIEDGSSVQLVVKGFLENAGYQVISALDAVQGVMMARQHAPDLIVLDVVMPAGGGESVFTHLRNMSFTKHTPILIYSGTDQAGVLAKITPDAQTRILHKLAPPSELIKTVNSMLGME